MNEPPNQPDSYKLYIIEDHSEVRRTLRRLFERDPDLTVVGEAASAEVGLEELARLLPDLITVDLSLPGMNGLELVKRLVVERPEVKCVVITGHTDPVYRAAAEEAGAKGYVTKDDPLEIAAAVRSALGL